MNEQYACVKMAERQSERTPLLGDSARVPPPSASQDGARSRHVRYRPLTLSQVSCILLFFIGLDIVYGSW